jgi:hypothetical protein
MRLENHSPGDEQDWNEADKHHNSTATSTPEVTTEYTTISEARIIAEIASSHQREEPALMVRMWV